MKKTILTLSACAIGMFAANGQQPTPPPPGGSYNPFLIQGFVSPAPMLPVEFNGTGTLTFDVGTTGSSDIVWVTGQEMLVTLSLSYGVPNVADPNDPLQAITAVTGPGAAWFNWEYFPAQKTFRGTQKATIPGGARETINIAYKVAQNSFVTESYKNGFNTNISPPGYTNPQPTDDDTVAAYTYVQAFDYGDAPATYGTPRHEVDLTKQLVLDPNDVEIEVYNRFIYLGTKVDPENASQPNSSATGDDSNQTGGINVDDEDGVVIPALTPGQNASISYTVGVMDEDYFSNVLRFSGWIDWNQDGDFADAGERIVSNFLVNSSGTYSLNVAVPANAVPGATFARFRIGPQIGALASASPTANVAYGEVEDYMVSVGAPLGTVSGHLYIDTNGDGDQDVGEPNLANVDVIITDSASNLQTVTTDSNGNWTANVPAGSTSINIDNSDPQYPTGYTQTQGNDPTVVSVIANQANDGGLDGFFLPGTVTGHLYIDTNGDGNQDVDEPNLANVDVIVTDTNGTPQTVTTDSNGDWTATVPPGSTSANIDENDPQYPAGYIQTEGTDPTVVTAVAGASTSAGNDGFHIPGTLTGRLYNDVNGDGNQDVGEPGIANVNVIITDVNNVVQTVVTDSNGNWTAQVPAGSTNINIDNSDPQYPTGYTQTEGEDPTVVVAVSGSSTNGGNDGFFLPSSISGITQTDMDSDDIGDLVINNVTYRLLNFADSTPVDDPNQAGIQPYVIVSTNGMYQFTNLPPGQYLVVQDQPAGFISQRDWDSTVDLVTSPVDPTNTSRTDNQVPIDLAAGEVESGNDFIEYRCPTLFSSWQLINSTSGGTAANPDGDIYSNLLEYGFCLPPENGKRAAYCIVPSISETGDYDLVFNRVAGGKEDTKFFLRYTGVLTTAAGSWTEVDIAGMANVTITPDVSGLSEQVRIRSIRDLLPSTSQRGFYQIALKLDYNDDNVVDVVDYTYVEGWQDVSIEANECETYSTPFLPCPQFTGVVTSMTGLTINLSVSAPLTDFTPGNGNLEVSPARYRIEVMSGPLNGHRFDVATGGMESLTLTPESNIYTGPPFGSLDTSTENLSTLLAGSQIMLVKYLTIEEMVPVAQMNATASATTADRVLFNDGISGWQTYWAYSNGGSPYWALVGSGLTNRSTDVVPAHQGFFVHTKSQAEVISTHGMVRQSNFALPISTSVPMFGSPYPMDLSPNQMAYLAATFTGSRDPASSDQVLHWTSDAALPNDKDGYSAYWLNKTSLREQWVDLIDTGLTNQNDTGFIRAGRSYWFSTTVAHPTHVVPLPWTLPARTSNGVAP